MNVCLVYCAKDRNSQKLSDICKAMAAGLASQGHDVTILNAYTDTDKRISYYDYVIMGTESTGFFSARIPEQVRTFLRLSPGCAGKRSFCFITKTLRSGKTLANLMKAMEGEGMMLTLSEIIRNTKDAETVGKHISIKRN